jgi:hypothetical protein
MGQNGDGAIEVRPGIDALKARSFSPGGKPPDLCQSPHSAVLTATEMPGPPMKPGTLKLLAEGLPFGAVPRKISAASQERAVALSVPQSHRIRGSGAGGELSARETQECHPAAG